MFEQQYPIILPKNSSRCEFGPIIQSRPGQIRVWYDSEGENSIVWTELCFKIATAFRYTPENALKAEMLSAYGCIAEQKNSTWLAEIESITIKRHQRLLPGLHHLMIFFDHRGCLEVIAQNVVISERVTAPEI